MPTSILSLRTFLEYVNSFCVIRVTLYDSVVNECNELYTNTKDYILSHYEIDNYQVYDIFASKYSYTNVIEVVVYEK